MQKILYADNEFEQLDKCILDTNQRKLLLVCGKSIKHLAIGKYFDNLEERIGVKVVRFCDFSANPLYESVEKGIKILNQEECKLIISVGGGSAIDVAKCIKLYAYMDHTRNYLNQSIVPNDIQLIAVPTTAGTGSETTRYAVIYFNGEKQSISDNSCIPFAVLMDPTVLDSLSQYQKKVTMLDALCHATEAFWSINSTEKSKKYSEQAIQLILKNYEGYLDNSSEANEIMLRASNLAGKAINIAQTTAGHAMSYKLTSLYGIAHGHAVALCVSKLFPYMIRNTQLCVDPRGEEYLKSTYEQIAKAYGRLDAMEAANRFSTLVDKLELEIPCATDDEFKKLKESVNLVRLKNNPISLSLTTIDEIYHSILDKNK